MKRTALLCLIGIASSHVACKSSRSQSRALETGPEEGAADEEALQEYLDSLSEVFSSAEEGAEVKQALAILESVPGNRDGLALSGSDIENARIELLRRQRETERNTKEELLKAAEKNNRVSRIGNFNNSCVVDPNGGASRCTCELLDYSGEVIKATAAMPKKDIKFSYFSEDDVLDQLNLDTNVLLEKRIQAGVCAAAEAEANRRAIAFKPNWSPRSVTPSCRCYTTADATPASDQIVQAEVPVQMLCEQRFEVRGLSRTIAEHSSEQVHFGSAMTLVTFPFDPEYGLRRGQEEGCKDLELLALNEDKQWVPRWRAACDEFAGDLSKLDASANTSFECHGKRRKNVVSKDPNEPQENCRCFAYEKALAAKMETLAILRMKPLLEDLMKNDDILRQNAEAYKKLKEVEARLQALLQKDGGQIPNKVEIRALATLEQDEGAESHRDLADSLRFLAALAKSLPENARASITNIANQVYYNNPFTSKTDPQAYFEQRKQRDMIRHTFETSFVYRVSNLAQLRDPGFQLRTPIVLRWFVSDSGASWRTETESLQPGRPYRLSLVPTTSELNQALGNGRIIRYTPSNGLFLIFDKYLRRHWHGRLADLPYEDVREISSIWIRLPGTARPVDEQLQSVQDYEKILKGVELDDALGKTRLFPAFASPSAPGRTVPTPQLPILLSSFVQSVPETIAPNVPATLTLDWLQKGTNDASSPLMPLNLKPMLSKTPKDNPPAVFDLSDTSASITGYYDFCRCRNSDSNPLYMPGTACEQFPPFSPQRLLYQGWVCDTAKQAFVCKGKDAKPFVCPAPKEPANPAKDTVAKPASPTPFCNLEAGYYCGCDYSCDGKGGFFWTLGKTSKDTCETWWNDGAVRDRFNQSHVKKLCPNGFNEPPKCRAVKEYDDPSAPAGPRLAFVPGRSLLTNDPTHELAPDPCLQQLPGNVPADLKTCQSSGNELMQLGGACHLNLPRLGADWIPSACEKKIAFSNVASQRTCADICVQTVTEACAKMAAEGRLDNWEKPIKSLWTRGAQKYCLDEHTERDGLLYAHPCKPNPEPNQVFIFEPKTEGFGVIKSKFSGRCIDLDPDVNKSYLVGGKPSWRVYLSDCHGRPNQLWQRWQPTTSGFHLKDLLRGACLNIDVDRGTQYGGPGFKVVAYECIDDAKHQTWSVQ